MSQKLIQDILDRNHTLRLNVLENDKHVVLCQLYIHDVLYEHVLIDEENGNLESIYVARVDKIMPSANCAFVDIGDKKMGFLPLVEKASFQQQNPAPLKQGAKILVQVRKEENAAKGAALSRDIKIPGQYAMVMPYNNHITISTRIADKAETERLIRLGKHISQGKFGIVFRAAAERMDNKTIEEEVQQQLIVIQSILSKYINIKPPYCIYHQKHGLREYVLEIKKLNKPTSVYVNSADLYHDLYQLADESMKIFLDTDVKEMAKPRSLQQHREKISLVDKSNIVIDYCEALTVFDINSSAAEYRDSSHSFFSINALAAEEVIRQIQLKNISGIILIDFINMADDEQYRALEELVVELLRNDRVKSVVHGFTQTGLLEITRKRTSGGEHNEVKQ